MVKPRKYYLDQLDKGWFITRAYARKKVRIKIETVTWIFGTGAPLIRIDVFSVMLGSPLVNINGEEVIEDSKASVSTCLEGLG